MQKPEPEKSQNKPSPSVLKVVKAEPQKVRWGPNDNCPAGIIVTNVNGHSGHSVHSSFVPWDALKPEICKKLIVQISLLNVKSDVVLTDFKGRKDWLVKVVDPNKPDGKEIAHIWFGGDPDHGWLWDGLVRVGVPEPLKVWQIFQRWSDGSYRRVVPAYIL